MSLALSKLKKRPLCEVTAKPKRKIDRFNGLTEEEVQKYTLEDILEPDLDLVFVGINPSLMAAHRGRYYAGPGNHFYKLLHESGLVPRFVSFEEDKKLLDHKIGLTNIVGRPTRSSADLKKPEIKEGARIVREKLKIFKPKIAVFNGKCIYEVFAEKTSKSEFCFGLQPERLNGIAVWVVPSSSARCAHFPRMSDKLHFYLGLKKYLCFLKGEIGEVDESEFRFEGKCKQKIASTSKMWRRKNVSAFVHGGRVANTETVCLDTSEENLATVKCREFVITEILAGSDEDQELGNSRKNALDESTGESNENDEASTGDNNTNKQKSDQLKNSAMPTSLLETRGNNLKRSWKSTDPDKIPHHPIRPRKRDDSMDFMNLIKKKLSEKRDRMESEEKIPGTSSKVVRGEKKLKYANLRLNIGKKNSECLGSPAGSSSGS